MPDNPLCDICGKDKENKEECAYMSCPKLWDEARIDIIGQNGNDGVIYDELLQQTSKRD